MSAILETEREICASAYFSLCLYVFVFLGPVRGKNIDQKLPTSNRDKN